MFKLSLCLFSRMSGDYHSRVVAALKRKQLGEPEEGSGPHKKRKIKGANPLSCLKKKSKPKTLVKKEETNEVEKQTEAAETAKKKKRNRKRKKQKNETEPSNPDN